MEEEMESGDLKNSTNNDNKVMLINLPPTMTKLLEFAKIPKSVVILSIILLSCIVFFGSYHSYNLFGFDWSFSSLYSVNGNSSSSSVHVDYDELRKVLQAASTEEKTVILTTLNEAWAKPHSIFDLFLESFRIGKNTTRLLNHLLVITVDEKAYARCRATFSHCYFFKTKRSREMAHAARFMSPIYMEMMWERLAFLKAILSLGFNFVFTDIDVMWFRDPFLRFDSNIDFQTSCDFYYGKPFDLNNLPNNGFNFVRSNERTIKFYEFWVSSRSKYPGQHEQNVFNKIKGGPFVKKIGLTIRFLETDYFGGFCSPSRDFNKVCTMHANCCVGLDRKIDDLKTMLEDWKRFVSNEKTSQRPHWRVPDKCHM